jgi:hypothetical protein
VILGGMRVTTSVLAKLTREQIISVISAVRTRKDRLLQNEKRKVERLKALLEKESHALENSNDARNVHFLLSAVQAFIDVQFGKGSDHAILWAEFMKLLLRADGSPRYSDPIMQMAMSLVPRTSKSVFESAKALPFTHAPAYTEQKRRPTIRRG